MSYLYFDKIGFSIRFPYFSCLVWEHLIKIFTMMTEAVNFVAVVLHIKEYFWFLKISQAVKLPVWEGKKYVFFSNINCRTIEKGEHKVFFSYLEGFLFHKNSFVMTLIFIGCFLWMWKNGSNRLGSDFIRFSQFSKNLYLITALSKLCFSFSLLFRRALLI